MPSPFPGMDPYIESPALWSDFHNNLASEIPGPTEAVIEILSPVNKRPSHEASSLPAETARPPALRGASVRARSAARWRAAAPGAPYVIRAIEPSRVASAGGRMAHTIHRPPARAAARAGPGYALRPRSPRCERLRARDVC